MRKYIVVGLMVLLALTFTACNKPPEMEMKAAQNALDSARAAQADVYDPAAFMMAMDTLQAAMTAKTEQDGKSGMSRNYDAAKAMFIRAKELSDQAISQAKENRELMSMEVVNMLANAKTAVENARVQIPAKLSKSELEGWKNMLNTADADIKMADSLFSIGDVMSAKSRLDIAMATCRVIADQFAVGSAPAKPTTKQVTTPGKPNSKQAITPGKTSKQSSKSSKKTPPKPAKGSKKP